MKLSFVARRRRGAAPARQRGAVLFVALMFLVLLSLLAVVASNTSILQERMTGGMRNSQMAQMGADSAVRGTEFFIWSAANNSRNLLCNDTGGLATFRCYQRNGTVMNPKVGAFRAAKGQLAAASDGAMDAPITNLTSVAESARLAMRPRVLVSELGEVLPPGGRATGRGSGPHSGYKPTMSGPGGGIQPFYTYRITARSTGGTNAAVRAAESVFVAQVQPITTP